VVAAVTGMTAGRQERPGSRIAAQLLDWRDPVTVAGPLRILRSAPTAISDLERRGPPDSIRPSDLMMTQPLVRPDGQRPDRTGRDSRTIPVVMRTQVAKRDRPLRLVV